MNRPDAIEDLLRRLAPRVLGTLVRRHGRFDACEDAVQEALLAAATQWPERGIPAEPLGWLVTVAGRRLADDARSEIARRRREENHAAMAPVAVEGPEEEEETFGATDDTLTLLFLCCHPSLSAPSQIALTLRAVGGLTTAQIAHAFLVPESTMAQRISRAKQRIRQAGATFRMPSAPEYDDRLRAVLHVLYLVFNEGYAATTGPDLQQRELTAEAIRLVRQVRRLLPDNGEVAGLLALMLLTDARRDARTGPDGVMVPLESQDRSRWDGSLIAEGTALISQSLAEHALGPYQVQAAIAAVHAESPSTEETDWRQILILYGILGRMTDNPMVELNRAVATAMVAGPEAGLKALDTLEGDSRIRGHYRVDAVRAHMLQRAGDHEGAREHFLRAARGTLSLPEQRYLQRQADTSSHRDLEE